MPARAALKHPEHIHPALWRASQITPARRAILPTGHPGLDRELLGGGWPLGTLIEFLPQGTGIGELQLLRPALAQLDHRRQILLVNPPYPPSMQCWANWGLQSCRLIWLQARSSESLWAVEQALRHNVFSALLCWAEQISSQALLRLQRLARRCDLLLIMLRPHFAVRQASPAPLRLSLTPTPLGLSIHILKQRGPTSPGPIVVPLYLDALDLPAPSPVAQGLPTGSDRSPVALHASFDAS
ncbi:MAG TPA: translesion DNA synthesis-associated protein ImuA [Castellaniella sp.]|nr:translesion DNA synthesis-associated protein ImuA [Castellaniella sp.]